MMALNREQIMEAAMGVRNGTIARVMYMSELPLKAEFKKMGYRLVKITETSARFGVNYGRISSVMERNATGHEPSPRTNNYEWVIPNKVKHNSKTDKDYLVLANFNKGHHTKTKYLLYGTMVGTLDMGSSIDPGYTHLVIDSYYKKSTSPCEVKTVSFENILRINGVGEKMSF